MDMIFCNQRGIYKMNKRKNIKKTALATAIALMFSTGCTQPRGIQGNLNV